MNAHQPDRNTPAPHLVPLQSRTEQTWPVARRTALEAPWMLDLSDDERERFLQELSDVAASALMEGTLLDLASLLTRWAGRDQQALITL